MKFSNSKRSARGFTLVELVIVIAVIAILAALLVPTILGQTEKARLTRAKGDVKELAKSIHRLRVETQIDLSQSANEACVENLFNLTSPSAPAECGSTLPLCNTAGLQGDLPCWGGPYQTNIINDPWNRPYTAQVITNGAVELKSDGPATGTQADDLSWIQ